MTPANRARTVELLASLLVTGTWAVVAWLMSWAFRETWDRCFLLIVAFTLALNLPSKRIGT